MPPSEEQWAAVRALREGAVPSFVRLAAAAQTHATTVRRRAEKEGWAKPPAETVFASAPAGLPMEADATDAEPEGIAAGFADLSPEERPARLMAFVVRQVETIMAQAQAGRVDKARIDAVWSMIRMVERAETFAGDAGQKKRSDDQLAETLRLIDDRIVELAQEHAERLVARQAGLAPG